MAKKEKIDFIESLGKLEYQDGDIIVLKCSHNLSLEEHANIQEVIKEHIAPYGKVKVIILEDGIDIGILRKKIEEDKKRKKVKGRG